MKTMTFALSALAVAAGLAVVAPQADAQTAARVESQTRPNFGLLLDPPARQSRPRQHRRWNYGTHRPGGGGHVALPPYRPGGQEEIVLVDCGGNPGTGAVEAAVQRVRPGGTLVLRARGGPCVGWLNIDKPLTIIGESDFDPRRWDDNAAITLQAPDGLPCLTVAQGVRVQIRDVMFASPRAGDAACVVSYGGEIVMNRVGFRHAGDEAAIYADGGLIDIRSGRIDAQTVRAAIVADGAVLTTDDLKITGAQSGIELTPGAGPASQLNRTSLIGGSTPNNFGPRAIGLLVRSARDYGQVSFTNGQICGYVEGVAIEGATVTVDSSVVCKAEKGLVLYNGELTLTNSRIRAERFGVVAGSGRAVVVDNRFARVQATVVNEARASIDERGSRVWTRGGICDVEFVHRYRDRYALSWKSWRDGDPYRCEGTPYPAGWWSEEEGSLGDPYYNDGWNIDGYDAHGRGQGWYDCEGRHVNDSRYSGLARWTEGGWGSNRACRRPRPPFRPR